MTVAVELDEQTRALAIAYDTENLLDKFTLTDDALRTIGDFVVDMYDQDNISRNEWLIRNEKWIKLASQILESKNYPWENASNVKYPLLSTASLQFHARAYSALIPDGNIVKIRTVGKDVMSTKRQRADRVSMHMSHQLLDDENPWQEDQDRLLYILPIVGMVHKKTYFSALDQKNKSKLVLADDLVINYYAEDYAKAIKTHRVYLNSNDIYELQTSGYYREVELKHGVQPVHEGVEDEITGLDAPTRSEAENSPNSDVPFEILESHTYYDLDGDGYAEPLIITVEKDSRTVLRISRRYYPWDIMQREDGTIIKIKPKEYFTLYGFFPNPESAIYFNGFGALLGPLNSAADTVLNQLIDAGHLANMQGGFLGKGIRVQGGRLRFQPGEWKVLQTAGTDIKQNIYPLPVKEPSSVLFQLLGLLIEAGERLASVKDMMVGENPGQNQPYATTVAVLEQGMKVFTGIYKRLYRALTREYKKWYMLNALYLPEEEYLAVIDDPTQQASLNDYNLKDMDIVPNADPSIVSEAHRLMKSNSLLQKKAAGMPINTMEITRRVLESEGHENIEALMQPDPPSEDPELTFKKQEAAKRFEIEEKRLQLDAQNTQFEAFKDYAQAMSHLAKAAQAAAETERAEYVEIMNFTTNQYKAITDRMKITADLLNKDEDREMNRAAAQQAAQQTEQTAPQEGA